MGGVGWWLGVPMSLAGGGVPVAAAAMALFSLPVVTNANRLRR